MSELCAAQAEGRNSCGPADPPEPWRHSKEQPSPSGAQQACQTGPRPAGGPDAQPPSTPRFLASKLNTGSLWSLLAVSSAQEQPAEPDQGRLEAQQAPTGFLGRTMQSFKRPAAPQASPATPGRRELLSGVSSSSSSSCSSTSSSCSAGPPSSLSSSASGPIACSTMSGSSSASSSLGNPSSGSSAHSTSSGYHSAGPTASPGPAEQASGKPRRTRFQVKYIGSASLHRNFTFPMLEWIARDLKRQTTSCQSSRRQFAIPARDIVLEIQAYQLTAVSCRDGHCVFVHPMHCVSKYAQLQHEPTCFSYLIRDAKDAPYNCHVFQAKSAHKVHDIFGAIREAASCREEPSAPGSAQTPGLDLAPATAHPAAGAPNPAEPKPGLQKCSQTQQLLADRAQAVKSPVSLDNSYQFEVMLVKKVKLQCRRAPASFVDDALATLKSFEARKGSAESRQSKAGHLGKRIISACVDERQEYDDEQDSSAPAHHQPGAPVVLDPSLAAGKAKHASLDCLAGLDWTIRHREAEPRQDGAPSSAGNGSASAGQGHTYVNDFSPYNTITSDDLNQRIAAIPVVSSSVSLDHESRQRLARQVRETIMATAASINERVYGSNSERLDANTASGQQQVSGGDQVPALEAAEAQQMPRRRSAGPSVTAGSPASAAEGEPAPSNNFDLFRRASARQVIKNRTVLLLLGKHELCAISIDKHQLLFSKSLESIVHCLQGNANKDHFGLICRDSGKINPQAESYAGFVFKCQSDKVVREIMSALRQVIHGSQHSANAHSSPYNPRNAAAADAARLCPATLANIGAQQANPLAAKRGFFSSLMVEVDEAARWQQRVASAGGESAPAACLDGAQPTTGTQLTMAATQVKAVPSTLGLHTPVVPKNPVKSMFCDQCPLYWYHRLCCDIESLSADDSKAIILRRIESSLSEREQQELYSKFSEFVTIESVDEHNEVFMSLLRHLSERKQTKHVQTQQHLTALASNAPSAGLAKRTVTPNSQAAGRSPVGRPASTGHQRSGSTSGSLASLVMGTGNGAAAGASSGAGALVDASTLALDNIKRAKNSISVSIENLLKRRSSLRDEANDEPSTNLGASDLAISSQQALTTNAILGFSPFNRGPEPSLNGSLRRSQSTTDHSRSDLSAPVSGGGTPGSWWKDSLSKTINDDLVGLFRRRSSTFGSSGGGESPKEAAPGSASTLQASGENLQTCNSSAAAAAVSTYARSPGAVELGRFRFSVSTGGFGSVGHASPSGMLSSAFWKKSIFDKIRGQAVAADSSPDRGSVEQTETSLAETTSNTQVTSMAMSPTQRGEIPRRSSEQLRALWRKTIIEQITLLKMDKQNQRLARAAASSQLANDNVSAQEQIHRLKLSYRDTSYGRQVFGLWDKLLKQDPTTKVHFGEVARLVGMGVPKQRRGEIWMFLMNQYQLRHGSDFQPAADNEFRGDANQPYKSLLSQLSVQQHEIFVDIGRTFPSHPYYSNYLSIGQLSLFNLLKAYSLLDPEVGYCQGLSFVAGILLLHVDSEDEAFELMRHLLFNFGLRKQYLPSMNALHLQLYQMTRLLRDHEYDLFDHFDRYDISPSLYAAPWFLTLFASQFPLGFVARLLDLIYLIGIEAIFRVSLNLLAHHRAAMLECKSLESAMDFIKTGLVDLDDSNLVEIFDKCMTLDLRNKLIDYEIEYTFYCAEDMARCSSTGQHHVPSSGGSKAAMLNKQHTNKISLAKSEPVAKPFPSNSTLTQQQSQQTNTSSSTTTSTPADQAQAQSSSSSNALIGQLKPDEQPADNQRVADATATVIIQHLLANNHLKSLRSNYSY